MKRRIWLQLTIRLLIGTILSVAIGGFVLFMFAESFSIVPIFSTVVCVATVLSAAGFGILDWLFRKMQKLKKRSEK